MKISFEIKKNENQNVIFINDELFDWGIDEEALFQANQLSSNPSALKAIHIDIKNYFLDCIEELIGFRPTILQINEALKIGYISND